MHAPTLLVSVLIFISTKFQAQADDDDENTSGRPWINPLQELQRITPNCTLKMPGFDEVTSGEEKIWQNCVDHITLPITEKFPVLESRSDVQEEGGKINSSVIQEIDKELHMIICRNTSAYKSCWLGIIKALDKCDPGRGDVSGKLYFALYDDICQDKGRFIVENRRKAALEGKLCDRNYSVNECTTNIEDMNSKNLCLRFQSNVACDLKSIDPHCQNKVDKGMHAEIFERVGKVLDCPSATKSVSDATVMNSMSSQLSKTVNLLFLITVFISCF